MKPRPSANPVSAPLLALIERRFGVRLSGASAQHLRNVCEHYRGKRTLLLWEHGEAGALARKDYAKAVMISEAANLMLLEIDPWPRRKKSRGPVNGHTQQK